MSAIGELNKEFLAKELNYLFDFCASQKHIKSEDSFPNYWRICGVPENREAEYIDILFKWLKSSTTNVTAKSRSLFVLFELTKKYPELKNELILLLQDEMLIQSLDLKKRVQKILLELDKIS